MFPIMMFDKIHNQRDRFIAFIQVITPLLFKSRNLNHKFFRMFIQDMLDDIDGHDDWKVKAWELVEAMLECPYMSYRDDKVNKLFAQLIRYKSSPNYDTDLTRTYASLISFPQLAYAIYAKNSSLFDSLSWNSICKSFDWRSDLTSYKNLSKLLERDAYNRKLGEHDYYNDQYIPLIDYMRNHEDFLGNRSHTNMWTGIDRFNQFHWTFRYCRVELGWKGHVHSFLDFLHYLNLYRTFRNMITYGLPSIGLVFNDYDVSAVARLALLRVRVIDECEVDDGKLISCPLTSSRFNSNLGDTFAIVESESSGVVGVLGTRMKVLKLNNIYNFYPKRYDDCIYFDYGSPYSKKR